jgi:hypothetical protein
MNTIRKSPFTNNRFEHDNVHLYYLDEMTLDKLTSLKSTYIIGSRGTGKTTMLTALSYSERLENKSLKKLLNDQPFNSKLVGVYIKLPEYQFQKIDNWLNSLLIIDDYAAILCFYLDILCIEMLCRATEKLLINGIINVSPEKECEFCKSFLNNNSWSIENYLPSSDSLSLLNLSKAFLKIRIEIDLAASRNVEPIEIINKYNVVQIGKLGRDFCEALFKDLYPSTPDTLQPSWHCKFCFDESECLSAKQQKVLNSMIRLSRYPLFYVASFVRQPDDSFSTYIPNLSVGKADCQFIFIDNEMERDSLFRNFVEGVSRVRIEHILNSNATFELSKILGRLSINKLLQDIMTTSVSSNVKQLLIDASEFTTTAFYIDQFKDDPENILPIYQTYLFKMLNIQLPIENQEQWSRRKEDCEQFRKKMVSAYLSICDEFNFSVRYCSADMVIQMSDTCIRDFLSQMDSIFKESGLELSEFLTREVSIDIQDRALKRASREKLESMPKIGARHHRECSNLVNAIGKLTQQLQHRHPENKQLQRPELGNFVLILPKTNSINFENPTKVLFESVEYGYIRVLEKDEARIVFRLHTSLAPQFLTSYRGSYYECIIDPNVLIFFQNNTDSDVLTSYLKDLVTSYYRDEKVDSIQISLFDNL